MTIAVIDTETTGLDARRHEIWEVALILHTPPDADGKAPADEEYLWQLPVDLETADPMALSISGFYQRRWSMYEPDRNGVPPALTGQAGTDRVFSHERQADAIHGGYGRTERLLRPESMAEWAERFATLTAGRHILGAVPSFDERRLDDLLREHGAAPAWHYHLIDIEAMVAGYNIGRWAEAKRTAGATGAQVQPGPFRLELPWKSAHLSKSIGVNPDTFGKHEALGDCRWALEQLLVMTGQRS